MMSHLFEPTRRVALSVLAFCALLAATPATFAGECTFVEDGDAWTLQGDCETKSTIFIPDGMTLDGAGHTIKAIEDFEGGWVGAIVQNDGGEAHVRNLTLNAEDLACVCQTGDDRLHGIRFDGAGGSIVDNLISGVSKGECGCQDGEAIFVRNPPFDGSGGPKVRFRAGKRVAETAPEVKIWHNSIRGYQKAGIVAAGHVLVDIQGNLVRGSGPNSTIGQNGIQVSFGATGRVSNNTVTDNVFIGGAIATGIFVFESDAVQVLRNHVLNNQGAIAVEAWCWLAPSADDNRVAFNLVDQADTGISIAAFAYDEPWSSCGATTNNTRVTHNKITTDAGFVAVSIVSEVDCDGCGFMPQARDTAVRGNTTKGFDFNLIIREAGDPPLKYAASKPSPSMP